MLRRGALLFLMAVLGACSANHEANPSDAGPPVTAASSTAGGGSTDPAATTGAPSASTGSSPASTVGPSAPTTAGSLVVTGRAVAGVAGAVETAEPFTQTDPFSEAVRLADGTCVGWSGSTGGSTAGLVTGAAVTVLDAEDNTELGDGSITASRWEDMAGGGEQWNCSFDFSVTLSAPVPEFRIKVGALAPWRARPDSTAPGTFTASVSTDASIGLIAECPAVASEPDPTATTLVPTATFVAPTTTAPALVTGWSAVGQYWSNGVRALCTAGLSVTAIARPCRPPGVGSEYIASVVDSSDPTVTYADGEAIQAGTELTVVVATGRPCD